MIISRTFLKSTNLFETGHDCIIYEVSDQCEPGLEKVEDGAKLYICAFFALAEIFL